MYRQVARKTVEEKENEVLYFISFLQKLTELHLHYSNCGALFELQLNCNAILALQYEFLHSHSTDVKTADLIKKCPLDYCKSF
jgi:hypothetical protein